MPQERLRATVRHTLEAAIVDLSGEIDGLTKETLDAAYDKAEAAGAEVVLLNFSCVEYINSTGIALIVGLLARARASHRCLYACGLSDHYVEIFNITRLSDFMSVFDDEESALGPLGGAAVS